MKNQFKGFHGPSLVYLQDKLHVLGQLFVVFITSSDVHVICSLLVLVCVVLHTVKRWKLMRQWTAPSKVTSFHQCLFCVRSMVTMNQVKGIFGFDGSANIGKIGFPAIQA